MKGLDNDLQLSGAIAEYFYTSIGFATIGESFGERKIGFVQTKDNKIICSYYEYNESKNNRCSLQ
jgi:hypothetical protein